MGKFKVGNFVWQKNGSPKLIITDIKPNGITCQWFDKSKLCVHTFKPELLSDKVPEPELKLEGFLAEMTAKKSKQLSGKDR